MHLPLFGEGMRGAARSSASARIPGRLLERHGNMPPREMIIHEKTVCEDTSFLDRTRLTGRPGRQNRSYLMKERFCLLSLIFRLS